MLRSRFKQSGNQGTLIFSGEATVPHTGKMRTAFLKALLDSDHILLDFHDVTAVDLCCLQLLCSAHRTAGKLKKRLTFAGSRPDLCSRVAETAGFLRSSGCGKDCDKTCLREGTSA